MGEPELQIGSEGDWVRYLQELLVRFEYDLGDDGVSGRFGPDTEAAVRLYQQHNVDAYNRELTPDGIVDARTWSSLTQASEIEGEARPPGDAGDEQNEGGEGLYYDDSSVRLVMQTTNNTCWAAAVAMLLGRSEDDVIRSVVDAGVDGDNEPEINVIANQFGLSLPGGQYMDPHGWAHFLQSDGATMVGVPGHYIVIAGITSDDGAAETTKLHVLDPDRGDFWMPFNDVNNAYEIDPGSGANLVTR